MSRLEQDILRFCAKWKTGPGKVKELVCAIGKANGIRSVSSGKA